MNAEEYTKYLRFRDKSNGFGIVFTKEKFDPNNFWGERFKKVRKLEYKDHEGEMVLENPNSKETSYSKELVQKVIQILDLMGYQNIKFWLPHTDSPMIITYDYNKPIEFTKDGTKEVLNHLVMVAPRIKNY